MDLAIRMILYYAFAAVGGAGFATYDPGLGTLTISIDQLAPFLVSAAGFVGTFAYSRFSKARGGTT